MILSRQMTAIAAAGAIALSGVALAQQGGPPLDSETARLLLQDLGAPDFHTRESASDSLRRLPLTPEEIVAALPEDAEFSPEQWFRLDEALLHRFKQTPRAGLGVGMQRLPEGIALTQVMDRFPSSDHLQPGDVVVRVEDRSILEGGTDWFRAAILSRDPGDLLKLSILRDGREQTVRVPLGRYSDLNNPNPLNSRLQKQAWEVRRERLGIDPPSAPSIAVDQSDQVWRTGWWEKRLLSRPVILSGGQALSSPQNFWGNVRVVALLREREREQARGRNAVHVLQRPDPRPQDAERLREQLTRRVNLYRQQIGRLQQRLGADDVTRDERIKLLAQIRKYQTQLDAIQVQLLQLRGDQAPAGEDADDAKPRP